MAPLRKRQSEKTEAQVRYERMLAKGKVAFGSERERVWRRVRLRRTIKDCGRAIDLNPRDAEAYYKRGVAYVAFRNYAQAIENFGRVIKLNPKDAKAYYNRGCAYAQSWEPARAIEDFGRAIELSPALAAVAYYDRGLVYAALQDYARAIEDFGRAIKLKSGFAMAHYNVARVYALMGKARDACEHLEKAIGLNEGHRRMAWNDEGFDRIREDGRFIALIGMNEYYKIIPGEAIGPFKLGMTRNEIERVNIRPMENFKDNTGVDFSSVGVRVFYDASGKCSKIEAALYSKSAPTFVLSGHIVNGTSADEAKEIFMSIAGHTKFGYASFELPSAGLRAIKWEAGDDFIYVIQVVPREGKSCGA